MTTSLRCAIRHDRPFYWALLLSLVVHGAALGLFPTVDAGARSLRVRLAAKGAATGLGASGDAATPRMVSKAERGPTVRAPKQAQRDRLAASANGRTARLPDPAKPQPDSAPLTPEAQGLDAGALRGLRIALASGLAGLSLPADAAGVAAEARLVFGDGGRLLAVSFSGERNSRALELRLRDALMKAAARIELPTSLRGTRFELELVFEVSGDGR